MLEEGSQLLSRNLKSLDTKLDFLGGGNRDRKRKQIENGGMSSQTDMLKDLIQVKKIWANLKQ